MERKYISIIPVMIFLVLGIGATVLLLNNSLEIRKQAAESIIQSSSSVFFQINYSLDKVIGQPNFFETMTNQIVGNRGFQHGGVHFDNRGYMYVVDSGNNRILGFTNFQGPDQSADTVIGQSSLTEAGSANGDNTANVSPTALTLALLQYPFVITPAESARFVQLATDSENSLYVLDLNNNRVLKYQDPFTADQVADDVWGQRDFTSDTSTCGYANFPVTAERLCTEYTAPDDRTWNANILAGGVDTDSQNNLWVTDSGNNRVLRFPPGSKTADLVLGQPDFTSYTSPNWFDKNLSQMNKPTGVKIKVETGEVYVAEGGQAGDNRILVFTPPFTNGMTASRVIGRATYQDTQPTDITDWENINGKWVYLPSGLHWVRSFAFDKSGQGDIWVNDGGNNRVILFNTSGQIVEAIGQPSFSSRRCDGIPGVGYIQYNGTFGNLCNNYGEIGIDAAGSLWVSKLYYPRDISRFTFPLQRNEQGIPISDAAMFHDPEGFKWNRVSGKTFDSNYGLAIATDSATPQMYVGDTTRIMVFSNYRQAGTYQQADFAIGQDNTDSNKYYSGGLFDGRPIGSLHANGGYLFAGTNNNIYIFQTPITSSGKNYPTVKVLTSGVNVFWADDNTPVSFNSYNGLYYDADNDALWVSDGPNNRVLRISHPLTDTKVDLVLGQSGKFQNQDYAGLSGPNEYGFTNPWYVNIDQQGNFYVVDSKYEGLGGAERVLRFSASSINPINYNSNIFPLPAANGIYTKKGFNSNQTWGPGTPEIPTSVAFDSQNRMLLTVDSYGNKQNERVFIYDSTHTVEVTPQPYAVVPIPFGQTATAIFDPDDKHVIFQDHTWNRILFVTLNIPQPTPEPTPTLVPTPAPSPTPILPTPTPTPTPSLQIKTIVPVADTYVRKDMPNSNFGLSTTLTVDGTPITITYLRFDLSLLNDKTIIAAYLKLRITNASTSIQYVKQVDNTIWGEKSVTYNTRPGLGATLATFSNSMSNSWRVINIKNYVQSKKGRLMSLGIDSFGGDDVKFYSRENPTAKPILEVTYQ